MTFVINLSLKPLSSTWIISVFITICSLEIVQFVANLCHDYSPKMFGSFARLRCVVEKNNLLKKVTLCCREKLRPLS